MLGNINDNFETIDFNKLDVDEMPELEQLMLHKIFVLDEKFKQYFNNYIHNLYKELLNFCTVDLFIYFILKR